MKKDKLLIIFAKEPRLGKVKTRLAKDIGEAEALKVYKNLLKKTFSTFWKTKYKVDIHFSSRQKGRDLGARMLNAFSISLKKYKKVVLIGVDCPFITKTLINKAFIALSKHELVIGPTQDGGYYLIGLTKIYSAIFKKISWGTNKVLKQTLRRSRIKPYLLKKLYDIDTIKDLKKWGERK
jgi:glycosyltransferase A (GT-A) superfamily protein (DUF2064 family)